MARETTELLALDLVAGQSRWPPRPGFLVCLHPPCGLSPKACFMGLCPLLAGGVRTTFSDSEPQSPGLRAALPSLWVTATEPHVLVL